MKKNIFSLLLLIAYQSITHAAGSREFIITDKKIDFLEFDCTREKILVMKKTDFIRFFNGPVRASGKISYLKNSLKESFSIVILYHEDKKEEALSESTIEYIKSFMPKFKAIISVTKEEYDFLRRVDQLIEASTQHVYVDDNLNIRSLSSEKRSIESLIKKWPVAIKFNKDLYWFYAPLFMEEEKLRLLNS